MLINMASDTPVWYFAYGANMDEQSMRSRHVTYTQRQRAYLQNYQLDFSKTTVNGPSYANVRKYTGHQVHGWVYSIPRRAITRNLDYFEGVPYHYKRKTLVVTFMGDGVSREAIVYVASVACVYTRHSPYRHPTPEYYALLRNNVDDTFPVAYVEHLEWLNPIYWLRDQYPASSGDGARSDAPDSPV